MNLSTIHNLILFEQKETKHNSNDHGQLESITFTDGFWIKYKYDDLGRVIEEKHSDGRVFKYSYDGIHVECERDDGTVHQVIGAKI